MEKVCETCFFDTKGLPACLTCDDNYSSWEPKEENPYWERICGLSAKQRAKGLETYGQGLESNPAAMQKRIEHLQEELIDALMYCEWMKDKLTEWEGEADDQN